MGGAPIIGYYDKLNELIVSTFHMINVFDHSKAVANTFGPIGLASRVATVGMFNLEKDEETMFFDLDESTEKRYYYAFPEKKLKTDNTLLKTIREKISKEIGASYAVYSTNYDQEYVYCVARSCVVQKK